MYFDDIELNTEIRLAPAVIEKQKMLEFSREYNNVPLHTDEEYAKRTPFGKPVASGVMSYLLVWSKYLEVDILGDELIAGKSTKIEWYKPTFAGDVLTGKCVVTKLTPRNEKKGQVEMTIYAYNGNGDLVLTGVVETIVKRKPAADSDRE